VHADSVHKCDNISCIFFNYSYFLNDIKLYQQNLIIMFLWGQYKYNPSKIVLSPDIA